MTIFIFIVAHWYLSLFAQSFFHHRYSAHQMFSMPKWVEKFFFVFSFITQGSSYMSPKVYGALHRLHHIHADKEEDPHSPKFSSNFIKLMVKTYHKFAGIQSGEIKVDQSLTQNLPDWKWFDKMAGSLTVKILWALFYIWFYSVNVPADALWMWIFVPAHIVMGPIHGTVVNWFAHKIGYTNYKVEDTSKNLMPFDIFMLGEGYHNNHHAQGNKANFARKWYEIDPIYPIIRVMDFVGLIKLNPVAISKG